MKLKLMVEEVVTVATETLCHWNCAHAESDYPVGLCNLFGAMRELSDSEDVQAYRRLPECIAKAKEPYVPNLPKVGETVTFVHASHNTKHKVVDVRRGTDEDGDDWIARLEPPGPYSGDGWVAQRYLERLP